MTVNVSARHPANIYKEEKVTAIAIITDTDSSISKDVAAKYKVQCVPIGINFGTETFADGVDINDAQLFTRIDREKQLPTTSAPSAGQFKEAIETAIKEGAKTVICICVSSEVSATYNAALSAKDMLPDKDIEVIDSRSLSMGQGFMVLAAAEAAQKGKSKDEVISITKSVGERSYYFGALSTLKYLAMSGRVGHLAAGMGNILNIQPILTIREGKLEMLEKIRTRRKALARLIELSKEAMGEKRIERMALVHVNALEETRAFEGQLRQAIDCPKEIMICELGTGLSVHSGAGLIALAFVLEA
jgi:DegV family protein with EDD domain